MRHLYKFLLFTLLFGAGNLKAQITITFYKGNACPGTCTGSITAIPTGGTAPYTMSWNTGATTSTINSLCPGTYNVFVYDSQGAQASQSTTVIYNPNMAVSLNTNNVTCNGANNGVVSALASGGTPPYTYSWSTGAYGSMSSISNLAPGTYNVQVGDYMNCTKTATATITEPTPLNISGGATNASCFGVNDGTVSTTVNGGTPPYTYAWNNGATTSNISGLSAGTYTLTATDANGCTVNLTKTVNQPPAINISMSSNNVSCFGGNNGSLFASVSGGSPSYMYSWSTGSMSSATTGLSAGTYTLMVTDANGCNASSNGTVSQPSPLSIAVSSSTNISCNGGSNGSITVAGTGGVAPYTYAWSPIGSGTTSSGLSAGTYTITITDANGCSSTITKTLTQPAVLGGSVSGTNISCNGGSNGAAYASPTGGTAPYSYSWSPYGGFSSTASGLTPGSYTVYITDSKGCSINRSIGLTEPSYLSISVTSFSNITCNGSNNGSISVAATGGSPGYTYTWSPSGSGTTVNNLSAGTYSITVKDVNNCTAMVSKTLTQPTALTGTYTSGNVSCNGNSDGFATLTATGGTTPYVYSLNGGTYQPGSTFNGLSAGSYTATIKDAQNCTSTMVITITQPMALVATYTSTNVSCSGGNDGTASVTVTGGTPVYTYSWSNNMFTSSISNLASGAYTYTVTDTKGCFTTNTVIINTPSPLSSSDAVTNVSCFGNNDGSIATTVSGGVAPYSILWNNNSTTFSLTNLAAGPYIYTLTDANGCMLSNTSIVTEPPSEIHGNVTHSGGFLDQGSVILFNYQTGNGQMDTAMVVPLDANGSYSFIGVPQGDYIILVDANDSLYPNVMDTYYDNTVSWDTATIINAGCTTILTLTHQMLENMPLSGMATISGTLMEAAGFQERRMTPGDPIPGVDVSLEQNPGSSFVAQTSTDATGTFTFSNVPPGNYTIYVDVPGLLMTSTYNISISGTDSVINQNFYIDSVNIYPDAITKVKGLQTINSHLSVWPNPFNENLNVGLDIKSDALVIIELIDAMGRVVDNVYKANCPAGSSFNVPLKKSNLAAGTYFIKISENGVINCYPVIKL